MEWLLARLAKQPEREVVIIAKNPSLWRRIESIISRLETRHNVYVSVDRNLDMVADEHTSEL